MENVELLREIGSDHFFEVFEPPENEYSCGMHFHDLYELYFLEKGQREYVIDGTSFPVSEGSVAFIPPGIIHFTTGVRFRRKLVHFSVEFLSQFFKEDFLEGVLQTIGMGVFKIDRADEQKVEAALVEAEKAYNGKDDLAFSLAVVGVLSVLSNSKSVGRHPTNNGIVEKVARYLQENFDKNLNLDSIAKHFFTSKYYISHLFSKEKGLSIIEFLLQVRIEKSIQMLQNTDLKIKEISDNCGFGNQFYFSKRFTKITGITPLKYRKKFAKDKVREERT